MPYYVYKIQAGVSAIVKNLEPIGEFDSYKDAKQLAKSKREEDADADPQTYKVIFADNKLDAEEKLSESRDAPILREWEK